MNAIQSKKQMIIDMIIALQNNETVIQRIGGYTVENLGEEVKFQQERLSEMEWIEQNTIEDILQRKSDYEAQLTLEELSCKAGILTGIPLEKVLIIAKLELIDIALRGNI